MAKIRYTCLRSLPVPVGREVRVRRTKVKKKYSAYRGHTFKVGEEIVMPRNFLTDIGVFPLDLKGRVLSQNQNGIKVEWSIPSHYLRRYAVVKSGRARAGRSTRRVRYTYTFEKPYLPPREIPLMVTVISVHSGDALERMRSRMPSEKTERIPGPSSRRRAGDRGSVPRVSPVLP